MKIKNSLAIGLVVLFAAFTSFGQGRGFDLFGTLRPVQLAVPATMTVALPGLTNGPIDTHGSEGIACVYITSLTNGVTAGVTAQLYTSPDSTNWTAMPTYAVGTSTSLSYTNTYLGGGVATNNPVITQTAILPGVITTPTAVTAGWATPYLAPASFTNTGAVTITGKGVYVLAYNVQDAPRYLEVIYTGSNAVVSATFIGVKSQ